MRRGGRGPGGLGWGRLGRGARRESPPFRVAQGDLFPGEPPPSSSQPREQRVWEARPGSRSGGAREAGRQAVGAGEDASPHFLSRPNDGKAPSSQRLTEAASESGRVRVPYLTAALAPFLPQRPHPLRGLRPGSRKAGGAPRRGRNRGAAAPPAGAGRLCSRRADSLRWNRPRSPPARSALPQPCFHPRSLPREAGLAVQNGRRLLAPTAISLTPWPRYLKVLVRGCPGIDFDNHH